MLRIRAKEKGFVISTRAKVFYKVQSTSPTRVGSIDRELMLRLKEIQKRFCLPRRAKTTRLLKNIHFSLGEQVSVSSLEEKSLHA